MTDNNLPKNVVITGSTRGIGLGLSRAFLDLGCAVAISGRTQPAVQRAVQELSTQGTAERIAGFPCDVIDFQQVNALWQAALARFGRIDIWINNAGISHPMSNIWEHPPEQYQTVLQTNLVGMLNGVHVAVSGMLTQGSGAIYNLEGLGSDGRIVEGMALYGSTKAAVRYLDRTLAKQLKGKPVIAGAIAPGMVITDLVTEQFEGRPEDYEKVKPIFNIIAEQVETVAPIIARKILANRKNGALIQPYPSSYLMWKFMRAPFYKRNLFGEV